MARVKALADTFRAIAVALAASAFFSTTFVLNRAIAVEGGHWAWAVSLRYLVTAALLSVLVACGTGSRELVAEIRRHPRAWLVSSLMGFGVFGLSLTWAASAGPSWLVAGAFQCTVVAGPCLGPFLYRDDRRRVPFGVLAGGLLILAGVAAVAFDRSKSQGQPLLLPITSVLLASLVYPLGNRLLMLHLEKCGATISAVQRVLGMTVCSLVLYAPLSVALLIVVGSPPQRLVILSALVAILSGTVATIMFFTATEIVRGDRRSLAAVEAMQAAELLFAVVLGVLLYREPSPSGPSAVGLTAIIAGIVAVALVSGLRSTEPIIDAP